MFVQCYSRVEGACVYGTVGCSVTMAGLLIGGDQSVDKTRTIKHD